MEFRFPYLLRDDPLDGATCHSEFFSDGPKSVATRFPHCADFIYCLPIQNGPSIKFTVEGWTPSFRNRIFGIVGSCSQPQMGRIHASWIITIRTIMENAKATWYRSKVKNPTYPMGAFIAWVRAFCDCPMPKSLEATCPEPAALSVLNLSEEPLWKCDRKSLREKEFFGYVRECDIHTMLRQLRAGYWPAPGHLQSLTL